MAFAIETIEFKRLVGFKKSSATTANAMKNGIKNVDLFWNVSRSNVIIEK